MHADLFTVDTVCIEQSLFSGGPTIWRRQSSLICCPSSCPSSLPSPGRRESSLLCWAGVSLDWGLPCSPAISDPTYPPLHLCVAVSFPVRCPMNSQCLAVPRLLATPLSLRISFRYLIGFPSLSHTLKMLSKYRAWVIVWPTLFSSHLSETIILHCLMPSVVKTVILYKLSVFWWFQAGE